METHAIASAPVELRSSESGCAEIAPVDGNAPVISVIVPARNCRDELSKCLACLSASTYRNFEVIVVDDASTDGTGELAGEMGALVMQLGTRRGPAVARNRGARLARGEYLFFLDADVCVHADTLQLLYDSFARDEAPDAVFGSYDKQPPAKNVLSQYKNLFHHFVHQDSGEHATTFWSGCGAIRHSVFRKLGGFDARYFRPSIEDIELGMRLHGAGHKIMLNKLIQVTHLKHWTLWSVVKTDVLDRGVPWTELILRGGGMPDDLNLKVSQRISVILAYGLLVCFGFGVWYYRHLVWVPLFLLILVSLLDYWSIQRRFPTLVRLLSAFAGLGILGMIALTTNRWPLFPLALVVGIIAINFRFYIFFLTHGRRLLVLLLLPLHVLYYLYCGLAFAMGFVLHHSRVRKPVTPSDVREYRPA